eukprot:534104_1
MSVELPPNLSNRDGFCLPASKLGGVCERAWRGACDFAVGVLSDPGEQVAGNGVGDVMKAIVPKMHTGGQFVTPAIQSMHLPSMVAARLESSPLQEAGVSQGNLETHSSQLGAYSGRMEVIQTRPNVSRAQRKVLITSEIQARFRSLIEFCFDCDQYGDSTMEFLQFYRAHALTEHAHMPTGWSALAACVLAVKWAVMLGEK